MSSVDLNEMMLFVAVIDAGSFTLAAERLNMPKANISRKISKLEQRLGVALIERTTRRQTITEAGAEYLQHCRRIQQEVELAEAGVANLINEVQGTLKIGASVGIGHQILKDALGQFLSQFPKLSLELSLTNRRVDLIEEGYDLAIRIGLLEDSRLVAKKLGVISRRLYASPQYLSAFGDLADTNDILQCDFLVMKNAQQGDKLVLTNQQQVSEWRIKPKVSVDDFLVLKQLIVDGAGLAVLPDYMCRQQVDNGELVAVFPEWQQAPLDLYVLFPQHRIKLPKVKAFIEFTQSLCEVELAVRNFGS